MGLGVENLIYHHPLCFHYLHVSVEQCLVISLLTYLEIMGFGAFQ